MNAPTFAETDLHAFQRVFSGGAPIAASTAHAWRDKAGSTIRNAYGLSETASVSHAVPLDAELRVDPNSGALSIGIPIPGTTAEIVDEAGRPAAVGTSGEIVISGPGVMRGYWQRPVETEQALVSGRLHTGDIGFTDADGWFYIVDRMKDMIIVSGYKVWPREVEDVLYQHPSVREVAVVGIPDDYQGEAVKAFVSLRPGAEASAEELIDFCRERMAAYKRPRSIEFLVELPKTASGKILRREVRGGP
jgi:long-chain acyl-CoA synthetase